MTKGLVGALALAAGIAIENARLHQRVQEVAVFDERDRLARDLHDTVIQRLFAVGLTLQSIAGTVDFSRSRPVVSGDCRHRRHHPPGADHDLRTGSRQHEPRSPSLHPWTLSKN